MEGKGTDPYPLWLLHCFAMIEGILTELEVKGLGHASAMKTVGLVFYGDDNIYLGSQHRTCGIARVAGSPGTRHRVLL